MEKQYAQIFADPAFRALQSTRSRFTWTLAALMLGSYVSYILVIAFRPDLFARPLHADTVVTWGIPVAVGIILFGFVLTGIYVYRANGEFDRRAAEIIERHTDAA